LYTIEMHRVIKICSDSTQVSLGFLGAINLFKKG
jgi:hypothetical protein